MANKKQKEQRIAVASEGKTKDSEISLRGGRAPYYLVFEGKELVETIKNPFAVGGGGAGWSVAYMLADKNIDLVIAGRFGPNMEFALKEKKIKTKEAKGKISKAIK